VRNIAQIAENTNSNLRRFFGKAFLPRQAGKINAFENHRKTGASDFNRLALAGHGGKAKGAGFKTLEPDGKAIAFPLENLHERVVAIEKNEKVIRKRIGSEFAANDTDESVEAFPHIDGGRTEGNSSVGGNGQHEAMAARSSLRDRELLSRTVKPFGVMISMGADFGSTRVMGTKVAEDAVSGFCCCRYFLSQEWRALMEQPICWAAAATESWEWRTRSMACCLTSGEKYVRGMVMLEESGSLSEMVPQIIPPKEFHATMPQVEPLR